MPSPGSLVRLLLLAAYAQAAFAAPLCTLVVYEDGGVSVENVGRHLRTVHAPRGVAEVAPKGGAPTDTAKLSGRHDHAAFAAFLSGAERPLSAPPHHAVVIRPIDRSHPTGSSRRVDADATAQAPLHAALDAAFMRLVLNV
ncbi:MAG TPA: hypothetical protein VEI02_05780 [Planctomycetota bacterium]|nr:hypothetical protein [Planctomycetota bacterium]